MKKLVLALWVTLIFCVNISSADEGTPLFEFPVRLVAGPSFLEETAGQPAITLYPIRFNASTNSLSFSCELYNQSSGNSTLYIGLFYGFKPEEVASNVTTSFKVFLYLQNDTYLKEEVVNLTRDWKAKFVIHSEWVDEERGVTLVNATEYLWIAQISICFQSVASVKVALKEPAEEQHMGSGGGPFLLK